MAKINTTNYQPVTAWNGTQDLLIVEQPDGTKVATPEQVKQYVEAGDFEATGEVKDGHGNVLSNVVDEIGDLSQTGLTGDSVAEQLVAVNKVKFLPVVDQSYTCSSTNFEYTGINIYCPAGHTYIVRAQVSYSNSRPTGILASSSNSVMFSYMTYAHATDASFITFMLTAGQTAYIWGRWDAIRQNQVRYWIVDITD